MGKAIHADVKRLLAVLQQDAGRQGDHRRRGLALLGLPGTPLRGDGKAVDVGHVQIQQHHIKGLGFEQRQRRLAATGQRDLVAITGQYQLQQLQVLGHVIHRQNAQRRQRHAGQHGGGGHGLARRQGQANGKAGALVWNAADLQAPVHQFDQLAGNGGAQPGAAKAARGTGIGLREGGKHPAQLLRRHANAGVLHLHMQPLLRPLAHVQCDAADGGEFDGVGEQVEQHLVNAQGIALKKLRLLRGVIQMQREGFFASLQAEHVHQLLAQLAQREIAHLQLQRTFFEFGRIQNVVEQAQQGAPRLPHGGQLALLLWVQGGIEQGLGKPQNGVQRCADFMAHIGQKAAARLAGLFGLLFGLAQLRFVAFMLRNIVKNSHATTQHTVFKERQDRHGRRKWPTLFVHQNQVILHVKGHAFLQGVAQAHWAGGGILAFCLACAKIHLAVQRLAFELRQRPAQKAFCFWI